MSEYNTEDFINYRISQAFETIEEVQSHINNKFWNTAINRMYYACYYAVTALLLKNNIHATSHAGVRQKFGEHFVKNGIFDRKLAKYFTELFEKRIKGDYNDFFNYDEETVVRLFPFAKEFIEEINELLQK